MIPYEQILTEAGFSNLGPCGCQRERGYDFQHPKNKEWKVRIYPRSRRIQIRQLDVKFSQLGLTEENLSQAIEQYGHHE